jgi:hypothetical protein
MGRTASRNGKTNISIERLKAHAVGNKKRNGPACWVRDLPERGVIEEGYAEGLNCGQIADWLREDCGYTVPRLNLSHRLQRHFRDGHHEGSCPP